MKVLGVDPGSINAAIALINTAAAGVTPPYLVGDIPPIDKNIDAAYLADVFRQWAPDIAVIEKTSAMPKQGVASSFNFGRGCGIIYGVAVGLKIPVVFVAPQTWKKFYGLDADKERARLKVRQLFPSISGYFDRKKDVNRAEALLIANWYVQRDRPPLSLSA